MGILQNSNPIPSFNNVDRIAHLLSYAIRARSGRYNYDANGLSSSEWHSHHVNKVIAYAVGIQNNAFGSVSYVFIAQRHDATLRELANADYEAHKASLVN